MTFIYFRLITNEQWYIYIYILPKPVIIILKKNSCTNNKSDQIEVKRNEITIDMEVNKTKKFTASLRFNLRYVLKKLVPTLMEILFNSHYN